MNTMKLMFITLTAVALILIITLQYTPSKRESEEEEMLITIVDSSKTSSTTGLPSHEEEQIVLPIKRVTHRFLAEKNPRAADNEKFHCNKDEAVCSLKASPGSSCCNNKCVDLTTDKQNCGVCKNKCKYSESCCRGKCVNLAFDKRHCGECNHSCMSGGYCVYGMSNTTGEQVH